MPVMTVRLSRKESAKVARLAKKHHVSRSEVIRKGLAALGEGEQSLLDAFRGAIGIAKGGPRDLSSNPKHMAGYGR